MQILKLGPVPLITARRATIKENCYLGGLTVGLDCERHLFVEAKDLLAGWASGDFVTLRVGPLTID